MKNKTHTHTHITKRNKKPASNGINLCVTGVANTHARARPLKTKRKNSSRYLYVEFISIFYTRYLFDYMGKNRYRRAAHVVASLLLGRVRVCVLVQSINQIDTIWILQINNTLIVVQEHDLFFRPEPVARSLPLYTCATARNSAEKRARAHASQSLVNRTNHTGPTPGKRAVELNGGQHDGFEIAFRPASAGNALHYF